MSELSRKQNHNTKMSRWKKPSKQRIVVIIFLIFIISLCTWGIYTFLQFNAALKEMTTTTDPVKKDVYGNEIKKPDKKQPITMLILGLDSRGNIGVMNTDVIMAATLNPTTKSAAIVSIPRDTYVKVEGYRGRKANAFYALVAQLERQNQLESGDANTEIKRIFSDFLETPIDYVVTINFKTLEAVIDGLGGVEIDVDMDMRYVDTADGTNINLKKGLQVLDGKNTLDFVRYRQPNPGPGATAPSSDFERNQRQQQVIQAVVSKLKTFNAVLKIGDIFSAASTHIKTDLSRSEIFEMIKTYAGISNDKIKYIPIEARWQSPYMYPDEDKFEEAKRALQQLRE